VHVAFGTQHAMHMRHSSQWPARLYNIFQHYLINRTIFEKKKLLYTKCVFWFSLQHFSQTFLILRTERDMIINVQCYTKWLSGFNNCHLVLQILSMGLRQGSGLCSASSRKYSGTEVTNQNRHWNHHRWHATISLERTRLSCWCLQNHKGCKYRAPVRYVTKTWSAVLLNKNNTYTPISSVMCMTSC